VRWRHPQHGLISPAEFIAVAEESGLIVPLGAWVLATACAQAKAWKDAGLPPLYMAISLSSKQFKSGDLSADVAHIFQLTGLDPQWLCVELTESVIMDDAEAAIVTLQELQAIGVRIALDDFGTGYSSLSYLQRFPITTLKIDRSFVRAIPSDRNSTASETATIAMARSLRLEVVAEGVETDIQLNLPAVAALRCGPGVYVQPPAASWSADGLSRGPWP
jgi:EAL domain-containing protein (putative c-di-GMP-specific phosphodiesterase class I)